MNKLFVNDLSVLMKDFVVYDWLYINLYTLFLKLFTY